MNMVISQGDAGPDNESVVPHGMLIHDCDSLNVQKRNSWNFLIASHTYMLITVDLILNICLVPCCINNKQNDRLSVHGV